LFLQGEVTTCVDALNGEGTHMQECVEGFAMEPFCFAMAK
jgi:hypothetical protein